MLLFENTVLEFPQVRQSTTYSCGAAVVQSILAYYGKDLVKHMTSRSFVEECGGHFVYSSGDTQLLGIALTRALKPYGYTASSYLEEKFW